MPATVVPGHEASRAEFVKGQAARAGALGQAARAGALAGGMTDDIGPGQTALQRATLNQAAGNQ